MVERQTERGRVDGEDKKNGAETMNEREERRSGRLKREANKESRQREPETQESVQLSYSADSLEGNVDIYI